MHFTDPLWKKTFCSTAGCRDGVVDGMPVFPTAVDSTALGMDVDGPAIAAGPTARQAESPDIRLNDSFHRLRKGGRFELSMEILI